MRVSMTLSPRLDVGSEEQLFVVTGRAAGDVYDVSPDGRRFLINTSPAGDPAPITVILNWHVRGAPVTVRGRGLAADAKTVNLKKRRGA